MLGSFKDTAAKVAANRLPAVQRFGTVHSLRIDAAHCSLQAEVGLRGENAPIGFTIQYRLDESDGKLTFEVVSVAASREWIGEVARLWIEKHGPPRFPIDGLAAQVVRFLL